MGRDALLVGCHKMKAQNPLVKRDMAAFHDGAGHNREVATALIALMEARTVRLALQPCETFDSSTVRAEWAIRPRDRLHVLPGGCLIVEDRVCQIGGTMMALLGHQATESLWPSI